MPVIEELMDAFGLEPERFRLVWCSSAEAEKFVAAANDMTTAIKELGPSPLNADVSREQEVA